jgi:hypothetical protein
MADRRHPGEQARRATYDGRGSGRTADRPEEHPTLEELHARAEAVRRAGAALMARMNDLASKIEVERARRRAADDGRT